jgi:hypothetical protein
LAFIVQNLPQGLDDFGWMFAIGGLGIALTSGSSCGSQDGEDARSTS